MDKPEKQSLLTSVEESSIQRNPASEYQDFANDLTMNSERKPKAAEQPYALNQSRALDQTLTSDMKILSSLEKMIQNQIGKGL